MCSHPVPVGLYTYLYFITKSTGLGQYLAGGHELSAVRCLRFLVDSKVVYYRVSGTVAGRICGFQGWIPVYDFRASKVLIRTQNILRSKNTRSNSELGSLLDNNLQTPRVFCTSLFLSLSRALSLSLLSKLNFPSAPAARLRLQSLRRRRRRFKVLLLECHC